MTPDETAVREVVERFYAGIDEMVRTGSVDTIIDCWHHTPVVTSGHPVSGWISGWDEVLASWKAFAGFSDPAHGESRVEDLSVHLYNDVAYTTCRFRVSPGFGGELLPCTNVVVRQDGVWKLVHHHADNAPKMNAIIDKMVSG